MAQTSTTENLTKDIPEDIKRQLFNSVMQQEWEKVAEIYKEYPSACKLKITSSGETALHLAISDPKSKNKVENVKKLVRHIKEEDQLEVLNLQTEKGNTPLHSAAETGQSGKTCKSLIDSVSGVNYENALKLVRARCKKGESPLFKAVHYGRLGSFFYLHSIIREHFGENFSNFERNDGQSILDDPIIRSILVRDDGQSILHDAIIRENFGLAFYIIQLYKDLVNHVDNQGESPLYALARKPTAFKSGKSFHGWVDKLIYKCIHVEKLKLLKSREKSDGEKNTMDNGSNIPPEIRPVLKQSPDSSRIRYCFVIFGYGPKKFRNIYDEKLKHTWAKQVLKELLDSATMYFKNTTAQQGTDAGRKDVSESSRMVLASSSGTNGGRKDVSQSSRVEPSSSSGAGKDESSKIEKNDSVLRIAAKYGIIDVVKRIIDKFPVAIYDENINGNNVLLLAVEKDESSKQKDTALLIAAKYGIQEMVKGIIDKFPVAIYDEDINGKNVLLLAVEKDESSKQKDTALLIAAKYGIQEMVKGIIDKFPVAIYDEDINGKNVLLLAVEKGHLKLYKYLIKCVIGSKRVIYQREDKNGNTALHLAATYDKEHPRPWPVPGVALQMVWEVKWYEFVEHTMPSRQFLRANKDDQTPWDIFRTTHKDLTKEGMQWLQDMGRSCSVVAALIVTISFASSTTVPGGIDSNTGKPKLRNNSAFNIFASASLISLCFSVTALITFLTILTSRYHERDFCKNLPSKILIGLTSLFGSVAAMLVTFCAGRFLVFEEKIKYAAFPIYAVTFFPLCIFAVAQFSLYFDLVRAIFFSPFRYDISFPSFLKKLKKKVKKS
ncbi:hypothetical protein UlMin_005057 [Ulmus minor]